MADKKHLRNSTAEFLIFSAQSGGDGLEVRYENETIWLTPKLIAQLFEVTVANISQHLGAIYESGEIAPEATTKKFVTVQTKGSREVSHQLDHYNLDTIISVGYRVNSVRATQFRQWASLVVTAFSAHGVIHFGCPRTPGPPAHGREAKQEARIGSLFQRVDSLTVSRCRGEAHRSTVRLAPANRS
jgi:hypothetical protein